MADATTIALGVEAEGDLVAAAAISVGTAWDAATPVQVLLAAKDTVKLTADRKVKLSLSAAEAVTAGKLYGYVFWTMEDAITAGFTAE